jgi:uncharacterized membrane protein YjgN (DUF898 family)
MQGIDAQAGTDATPVTHRVEFRGQGREYFRIWIVNVALTLLTLGIYSAWAKVRTQRYFYGNTFVAGHSFEYHASAIRILIGRAIALVLFVAYTLSVAIYPVLFGAWVVILAVTFPWLVNSSIRFNARNSSWRNVRFNFTATYFEAFIAYVVWSVAALAFFPLIPFTRRIHDYFYVNHHRFGGHAFRTGFAVGRAYSIYMIGFILMVVLFVLVLGATAAVFIFFTRMHDLAERLHLIVASEDVTVFFAVIFGIGTAFLGALVTTMFTNLSLSNTTLEGGHRLSSRASPFTVGWIVMTNALLTLVTLGAYYPFARIRLARYRMGRYALIAASDLDEFTSEAMSMQNAIGQEIASFFDFSFGL